MSQINKSNVVTNTGTRYFLIDNTESIPSVLSIADELNEVSTGNVTSVPISKDSIKDLRKGINKHGILGVNNENATLSIYRQVSDGKYSKTGTSTYDRLYTWLNYAKNHPKAVSNTRYLVEITEPSDGEYEGTLVAVSITSVDPTAEGNSISTYNVEFTLEDDIYPLAVTHVAAVGTTAESFTVSVIEYPTETSSTNP